MTAAALVLWALATLFWWAFAFAPLPPEPPGWLEAARAACFGVTPARLPDAAGWLMLVLAPASLLVVLLVLWSAELRDVWRRAARSSGGRVVLAMLALAASVEGSWVWTRLDAAWRTPAIVAAATAAPEALPHDYPRQASIAPAFTLVDQRGASIALDRLSGKPVVLSFVFAHCTTLCPLIVETLKGAVPTSTEATVLLVTLDPWRDTPGRLPVIARRWSLPSHVHLLSARDSAEVAAVARAYGVSVRRDQLTGDITHPGLVVVIDAHGRAAYTFNAPSETWVRQALARLG